MRARSMLVGLATLAVLSTTGCAFQKPTLKFKTAQLQDVDLEGTTLNLVYTLKNPNPIGLQLASASYALEVEGHQVVSGKPPHGLAVKAASSTDLIFPAKIKFKDIASVVQVFLEKDTASYRASGEIGVQTPIGVIKLPLSYQSTFPVPKVPSFKFQSPKIQNISLTGARISFPVLITNRNKFALPLGAFSAGFSVAGVKVGSAAASMPKEFAAGQGQVVEMPVDIDFLQAGAAVANAIRNKRAQVKLDGALKSGTLSLPINLSENLSFR
jgi:LEA14-like dessication related protein